MGGPTSAERGTAARGTENRLEAAPERPQEESFSVDWLGLRGQGVIPGALAAALKWQLELDALRGEPPEPQQELAEKLLAIWRFLKDVEKEAERDPSDGALLVMDLRSALSQTETVGYAEVAWNQSIPVSRQRKDAPPLPVWAPAQFPPDMTADQIARYPKRPQKVDEIPPFFPRNVGFWTGLCDFRPNQLTPPKGRKRSPPRTTREGGLIESLPLADPEPKRPDNEQALQEALDQAMLKVEQNLLAAAQASTYVGSTPTVNSAIGTLSSTTLRDIARQTAVAVDPKWEEQKLIDGTEVILYHSVYTVVLDRAGNPFDLKLPGYAKGPLDYAILVPRPGSQMQRNIPFPGAVYVSIRKYGDSAFEIKGGVIKKVLFGGVGGFVEYGYGYSGPHEFQKTIQRYLDRGHVYIASVTVESAYKPVGITIDSIEEKVPQLVEASLPYTVAELTTRLKERIENYENTLKDLAKQTGRALVMEMIRENVKDYIKKKIGQKILPLVNLAFAVYDLVAGEEEIIRMRHAIACMILALKGRSDEDMTISAKVLSKIMADEFEDKIVGQLILKGAKAAKRAVASVKSARSAPQQDKPADKPDAPEPDPANLSVDPQGKADHPAPTTPPAQPPSDVRGTLRQEGLDADKPYDVVTHSTPQQMSEAARLTHHGQQPPGDDKRTQGDPAVDSRIAPPTAATGQETVEIAPGVLRRRGKKDGKDSPSPSHEKDSPDAAADTDPDADLADTQRELSQRGNRNREVDSSEVDEIRRSRHARERKGGNEDVADSKVLAKNMKKEGRLREGAEDEAHHIIPGNEPQAAEVVAILGEKGIGINEGFNGVYLTRGDGENVTGSYKHEFTFAQHPEYFVLLKGLVKKTDSPEAIRGKIRVLGGFLAKGELPTYKEVIETWKKMP